MGITIVVLLAELFVVGNSAMLRAGWGHHPGHGPDEPQAKAPITQ
jgi:hypothetical protein